MDSDQSVNPSESPQMSKDDLVLSESLELQKNRISPQNTTALLPFYIVALFVLNSLLIYFGLVESTSEIANGILVFVVIGGIIAKKGMSLAARILHVSIVLAIAGLTMLLFLYMSVVAYVR